MKKKLRHENPISENIGKKKKQKSVELQGKFLELFNDSDLQEINQLHPVFLILDGMKMQVKWRKQNLKRCGGKISP